MKSTNDLNGGKVPINESKSLKIQIGTKYVKEQLNETAKKHDKNTKAAPTHTMPKSKSKPKPKNKCDLGPDFVAPDGGWAWLVCIAAGCSNVSVTSFFSFLCICQNSTFHLNKFICQLE